MQTEPTKQGRLGFITGVVPKAKALSFERILFRATRGNMFFRQASVEDPVIDPTSGEKVSIFIQCRELCQRIDESFYNVPREMYQSVPINWILCSLGLETGGKNCVYCLFFGRSCTHQNYKDL
jgi:hypothetical protein